MATATQAIRLEPIATAASVKKEQEMPRIDLARIDNVPYYIESEPPSPSSVASCLFLCAVCCLLTLAVAVVVNRGVSEAAGGRVQVRRSASGGLLRKW